MTPLIFSVIIVLIIACAWKLISKKNRRKTGLWLLFACYLSITGLYWWDNISLWYLLPVSIVGGFLGAIWTSKRFRMLLFHNGQESKPQSTTGKSKEPKQGKVPKDVQQIEFSGSLKNVSTGDLIAELNERNLIHGKE